MKKIEINFDSEDSNNENMLEIANQINETVADTISSLVLILVAYQESNQMLPNEFFNNLQIVIQSADQLSQIAKELAEEDYEEYPDIKSEIIESADEVDVASKNLVKVSQEIPKSKDLSASYQHMTDCIRDVGVNCIRMLQIVFGASFKKILQMQKALNESMKNTDVSMLEQDPDKMAESISAITDMSAQLAEEIREVAKSEENIFVKQELLKKADEIEQASNDLFDAYNALTEDVENPELIKDYEQKLERLKVVMEEAKKPVDKSNEYANEQRTILEQNIQQQKEQSMTAFNEPVDKNANNELGMKVIEHLDNVATGVYWDDTNALSSGLKGRNDAMKYGSKIINEGKTENDEKRKEKGEKIKNEITPFLEESRAYFVEENKHTNEERDNIISKYKDLRETVVDCMINDGVDQSKIPNEVDVNESIILDEDEIVVDLVGRKKATKSTMKPDELDKVKRQFQLAQTVEFGLDTGHRNTIVKGLKGMQAETPKFVQEYSEIAAQKKNPKMKKSVENTANDVQNVIIDGKDAFEKKDEPSKQKAHESVEKFKNDLRDILLSEGVSKNEADKLLSELKRNEQAIDQLKALKKSIIKLRDSVEDKNDSSFKSNAQESVNNVKQVVATFASSTDEKSSCMQELVNNEFVKTFNTCKGSIQDKSSKPKETNAVNACNDYIAFLDKCIIMNGGTDDDKIVVVEEKPSEIAEKSMKIADLIDETKNSVCIGDDKACAELMEQVEEEVNELDEMMKKKGKDTKELEEKIKQAKEAVKEARKNGDYQSVDNALKKLDELKKECEKISEEEGTFKKEKERKAENIKDGIDRIAYGVDRSDVQALIDGVDKVDENIDDFIENVIKEAEKTGDTSKKEKAEKLREQILDAKKKSEESIKKGDKESKDAALESIAKVRETIDELLGKEKESKSKAVEDATKITNALETIDELQTRLTVSERIHSGQVEVLKTQLEEERRRSAPIVLDASDSSSPHSPVADPVVVESKPPEIIDLIEGE